MLLQWYPFPERSTAGDARPRKLLNAIVANGRKVSTEPTKTTVQRLTTTRRMIENKHDNEA